MDVTVEAVGEVTDDVVEGTARLLPQLSPGRETPTKATLEQMLLADGNTLYLGRLDGAVVGMLTLTIIRGVDGRVTGLVEDVVVDAAARGHGVGNALVEAAVAGARAARARRLMLRSARTREAAHRLYRRHGFEERPSPVLALTLNQPDGAAVGDQSTHLKEHP